MKSCCSATTWLPLSVCLLALTLVVAPPAYAQQTPNRSPGIAGEIKNVETKGKTTTVEFSDEAGTEYEFSITPKVEVEVISRGDDGFLAPGLFVKIDAIESNDHFFGRTFQVYPKYSGRVLPAKAVKAPPVPGQSQNLHTITGEIVRWEDKGEGKYHLLSLKVTPKAELTVYVEPSHRVNVVMSTADELKAGQSAVVTGRVNGPRLLASKITVNTNETLKSDDVLSTLPVKK